MGILPLEFLPGTTAESIGITGKEKFSVDLIKGFKDSLT